MNATVPLAKPLMAAMFHVCVVGANPPECYNTPSPSGVDASMCGFKTNILVKDTGMKKPATQVIWCSAGKGHAKALDTESGD